MHPKDISIRDYCYTLPTEKIALYPLAERDRSRLLLYRNGMIREDIYRHIAAYIPENSLVIFNNTKVVEARLLFQKPTGGTIEIFCLEPGEEYPDITTAMLERSKVSWKCLIGGASKWKTGQVLQKTLDSGGHDLVLQAVFKEKRQDYFLIELNWNRPQYSFAEILHLAGAIPLPPYIKRKAEESDKETYQTIYAHHDGSVAAPTAGLHFTENIFQSFREKNIQMDFVTLHVGAGTFKPVKSDTMESHDMHAEFIHVKRKTIETILKNQGHPIVATGTTSFRTLESLYWLGVKSILDPSFLSAFPVLSQWEAYSLENEKIPVPLALSQLLQYMDEQKISELVARTQLIAAPGYKIKMVDALVTNFHQPESTLLLLIAAAIGEDWRKLYQYALDNNFRFLSYGDGNLLWLKK